MMLVRRFDEEEEMSSSRALQPSRPNQGGFFSFFLQDGFHGSLITERPPLPSHFPHAKRHINHGRPFIQRRRRTWTAGGKMDHMRESSSEAPQSNKTIVFMSEKLIEPKIKSD